MVAFALRADGWYLRSDIIWHKSNPMPESVTDRPTKSHEYVFLLSKRSRYWYDADAIREPQVDDEVTFYKKRDKQDHKNLVGGVIGWHRNKTGHDGFQDAKFNPNGRNARSVWSIATAPYSEAHFATFPPALAERCIKAGCPEGGVVLDPFMGAGTVAMMAKKLQRNYVGIELNPEYVKMARTRIEREVGNLF
jgi:DNA modification methylase